MSFLILAELRTRDAQIHLRFGPIRTFFEARAEGSRAALGVSAFEPEIAQTEPRGFGGRIALYQFRVEVFGFPALFLAFRDPGHLETQVVAVRQQRAGAFERCASFVQLARLLKRDPQIQMYGRAVRTDRGGALVGDDRVFQARSFLTGDNRS